MADPRTLTIIRRQDMYAPLPGLIKDWITQNTEPNASSVGYYYNQKLQRNTVDEHWSSKQPVPAVLSNCDTHLAMLQADYYLLIALVCMTYDPELPRQEMRIASVDGRVQPAWQRARYSQRADSFLDIDASLGDVSDTHHGIVVDLSEHSGLKYSTGKAWKNELRINAIGLDERLKDQRHLVTKVGAQLTELSDYLKGEPRHLPSTRQEQVELACRDYCIHTLLPHMEMTRKALLADVKGLKAYVKQSTIDKEKPTNIIQFAEHNASSTVGRRR